MGQGVSVEKAFDYDYLYRGSLSGKGVLMAPKSRKRPWGVIPKRQALCPGISVEEGLALGSFVEDKGSLKEPFADWQGYRQLITTQLMSFGFLPLKCS